MTLDQLNAFLVVLPPTLYGIAAIVKAINPKS